MSNVTRLRTLTLKSKFKFGKYHDLTVQSVINSKGYLGLDYITKIYYGQSKVSFTDDILTMCGITQDNRIEKPGKIKDSQQAFPLINKAMQNRMALEDPNEVESQRKSNSRLRMGIKSSKRTSNKLRDQSQSTKSKLQGKNHGR